MADKIVLEKILRVNKPNKLRLSATLSALSNKIGVIPTKLVEALKNVLKNTEERTYVKLTSYEDKTFKTEIYKKTDSQKVRLLYLKNDKNEKKTLSELENYANQTLGTSYALKAETRFNELKGILGSIIKSQNKKTVETSGNKNKKA